MRLNRFIAQSGIASRRKADELISRGEVRVNSAVTTDFSLQVDPLKDKVSVGGRLIDPHPMRYWLFNKPLDLVCSRNPQGEQKDIFYYLQKKGLDINGLILAGRLDIDSEGLMLLTTDGDLVMKMTHPRYEIEKVYLVEIFGVLTEAHMAQFLQGVVSEGETLRCKKVTVLKEKNGISQLVIILQEGKKRHIRHMMRAIGLHVKRLKRIQMGPFVLGELPSGNYRPLTPAELTYVQRIKATAARPGPRPRKTT